MIPLEEAQARVLSGCQPLPPATQPIGGSLGLVTAEAAVAHEAVPPFDNTAMDGFAVRAEDTIDAPATLDVVGTLSAGMRPEVAVRPRQAVRIMTGAPIPDGADAVVMVELTTLADDGRSVEVSQAVPPANHIRRAGEDLRVGQDVFDAGAVLSAGHLGVLASLGIYDVKVHPRPRVGVMSTGDELIEGSQPLEPGQIRDSNRITLLSLVRELGCEAVDIGRQPDDEAAITAAIERATESCDALISSGGVSMGDFDYVKLVLDRIGDMAWMQVAIKPAKPLAFGVVGDTPVFGLPGNPVSSMVSFELFARPGLRKMMGHTELHRPRLRAVVAAPLRRRSDAKVHFARVVASYEEGSYRVVSAGGQGSHQLSAMAAANALAILPDGAGAEPGDAVEIMLLGS